VAVCLKILCFAIWMTIMAVLINGSNQRKNAASNQQLALSISEEEEIERWRSRYYARWAHRPWLSWMHFAA